MLLVRGYLRDTPYSASKFVAIKQLYWLQSPCIAYFQVLFAVWTRQHTLYTSDTFTGECMWMSSPVNVMANVLAKLWNWLYTNKSHSRWCHWNFSV